MPLLQVRITLEDVEPEVWRLIAIDGARLLAEVHDAIQIAMGWTDSHLHLFEHPDGRRWSNPDLDDETEDEDERTVALGEVLGAGGLHYEYDFGDSWSHRLELVSSAAGNASQVALLDGARGAPPEDCGGAPGYENLLAVLADPTAEDHDFLVSWASEGRTPWDEPGAFDPESLDVDAVNRRLRQRFEPETARQGWGESLVALVDRMPAGAQVAYGDRLGRARLQEPVLLDAGLAVESVQPFAWLLDRVSGGGLALTAAGRLPPDVVRAAGAALGWDRRWIGTMNREDHVPMARNLREWATKTSLVRKYRGTLLLTRSGAAARQDPGVLLHHLAAQALGVAPQGVAREAGVLLLGELALGVEPAREALVDRVAFGLSVLGYADEDRWSAPSSSTVSGLITEVWGLLGMLGLVESYVRDPLPGSEELLRDVARLAVQEG